MLYLEDYVELIEHLPLDLRERFTEMREMDLQVENSVHSLNDKVKSLFQKCAIKKGKVVGADQTFEAIRTDYYKVLEDADEKVQMANQIYDLVDRHLRKLDQELSKFKMELEADNAGITEILEQRSLELDNPISQQRGTTRDRKRNTTAISQSSSSSSLVSMATNNGDGPSAEKKIKSEFNLESDLLSHLQTPSDSSVNYLNFSENSLQALMMDADLNIPSSSILSDQIDFSEENPTTVETIQLPSQPEVQEASVALSQEQSLNIRRSTTTKVNYEPLKPSEITARFSEFDGISVDSLDTSGEHVSDSSLSSMPGSMVHRPSRTKKQTSKAAAWVQERMQAEARHEQRKKESLPSTSSVGESTDEQTGVEVVGEQTAAVEWNYDPNEPRYCLCNQVSYGEMVGCDNDKCTIEWFHYGCVGLTEAPKGKWYCPQCTQTMRRRNKR